MNKHKNMTNCPNCSSNKISYDIKTESLKCEHCYQKIESKKFQKKIKELDTLKGLVINKHTKLIAEQNKKLIGIKCKTCGAIKYQNTKDKYTSCILCGRNDLEYIENDENEPKYILPFLINKEEAYSKHRNALDKKYLYSSRSFLSNFKEENIIGVYVPYRIENNKYVCSLYGDGYATYSIGYNDGEPKYTVYKYRINREVEIEAKDIFYGRVDEEILTREDMIENIISEINPYDLKEKIELKKEYLEEYLIVKPNETPIYNITRKEKIESIAEHAILDDTIKYDYGIVWESKNSKVLKTETSYVYMPIWLYYKSKKINNKTKYYYVAINGRTNEIGMHLPFNKTRGIIGSLIKSLIVLIILAVAFISVTIIGFMSVGLNTTFLNIMVLAYFIVCFIYVRKEYKVIKAEYEGSNVINENDDKVEYKKKVLHRGEKLVKTCYLGAPQYVEK